MKLNAPGWSAGVLVAAWCLAPALTAVHLEAFSASIDSMAISANAGNLGADNPSYPVVTEYLYLTRPGTVGLLRLLAPLEPANSDLGFRLLMLASLVTILGAGARLAARWAEVPPWKAVAALVLVPGLIEASFGFNDNLVSAAFATAGLALIRPGGVARFTLAGALLAAATLARLDGLLAIPAAAGYLWLSSAGWRPLWRAAVALAAGYVLALGLLGAALHVNPVAAWRIANWFRAGHESLHPPLVYSAWTAILYFGIPVLLLLPVGAWSLARRTTAKRGLVLIVYPLLATLILVPRVSETRNYLLLLAPQIAILGGRGLGTLLATLNSGPGVARRFALVTAVLALATVLVPPPFVMMHDGPRTPIGRLWSPPLWWRWQRGIEDNLAATEQLVQVADGTPRTAVIVTSFDDDRFLHLRLLQRGYRLAPPHAGVRECTDAVEYYRRGAHELRLVRTHDFYLLAAAPQTYLQALVLERALTCPALYGADRIFETTEGAFSDPTFYGPRAEELFGPEVSGAGAPGLAVYREFGNQFRLRRWLEGQPLAAEDRARMPVIRVTELTASELRALSARAHALAEAYRASAPPPGGWMDFEAYRAVFANRYSGPR